MSECVAVEVDERRKQKLESARRKVCLSITLTLRVLFASGGPLTPTAQNLPRLSPVVQPLVYCFFFFTSRLTIAKTIEITNHSHSAHYSREREYRLSDTQSEEQHGQIGRHRNGRVEG